MNGSPSDDETAALLALDALLPGEQADAELLIGALPADLPKTQSPTRRRICAPIPSSARHPAARLGGPSTLPSRVRRRSRSTAPSKT
jgi:hypothetical protein